jgi:hypothetical protein
MRFHCASLLRSNGRRVHGFGLALARHSWRESRFSRVSLTTLNSVRVFGFFANTQTVLLVACWAERELVNARRETFVLASLYALC